jgi:anti-sigma B factor antagonist
VLLEDPISSSIQECGGVAVLAIRGDVDTASAAALKSAIGEALAGDSQALVLDLCEAEFFGSVGVQVLLEAQQKIGDAASFAVVADPLAAGRIVQFLPLDELLSVHETVEDALSWVTLR